MGEIVFRYPDEGIHNVDALREIVAATINETTKYVLVYNDGDSQYNDAVKSTEGG